MDGADQLIVLASNYGLAIVLALYLVRYITKDLKRDIEKIIEVQQEIIKSTQELANDIKMLIEKNTTLIDLALGIIKNDRVVRKNE